MVMLLSAVSCTSEWDEVKTGTSDGEKYITLEFKTPGVGVGTRAEVEDNACESFMSHIDVVIYRVENDSYPFHHERINVSDTPTGKATIGKTKKDFGENVPYRFYIIANSTLEESVYNNLSHDNFLKLDQTDEIIHLTGVDFDIRNPHYPQMFLMDGVAYMGENEPAMAGNIVINDPNTEEDVTIKVTLRRAAAKVQITINPGSKVTFTPELMAKSHGYMVRNMPIRTTLSAEGGYPSVGLNNYYWKSTTISQTPYFQLIPITDGEGDKNYQVQVTLYCYSHTWLRDEAFEKGTSVVLMLPLQYTENGKTTEYINNYYQLSFSKKETGTNNESYHLIKRNTYYDLRVNLNAPGAEDFNEPEEVKNIQYFTAPWEKVDLDVSGESGVKYLKVNKEKLYMYNVAEDNTSLYFSSSSPVTVTLVPNSAHYYNKYNVKTDLTDAQVQNIYGSTEAGSVSGNISVHSDIPTNYTIRYFKLKVTNQEGLTEYVEVEQYPLIYITNFLPWYSYRDDYYYRTMGGHTFRDDTNQLTTNGDLPTTYRYEGDHIVSVYQINDVNTTTREVKYTYSSATPSNSHGYTASCLFLKKVDSF